MNYKNKIFLLGLWVSIYSSPIVDVGDKMQVVLDDHGHLLQVHFNVGKKVREHYKLDDEEPFVAINLIAACENEGYVPIDFDENFASFLSYLVTELFDKSEPKKSIPDLYMAFTLECACFKFDANHKNKSLIDSNMWSLPSNLSSIVNEIVETFKNKNDLARLEQQEANVTSANERLTPGQSGASEEEAHKVTHRVSRVCLRARSAPYIP